MRSSISSSDQTGCAGSGAAAAAVAFVPEGVATRDLHERPGFVRLTASDRPGVAQPVPVRDVPPQPWRGIFIGTLVLTALLLAGWEYCWRAFGATPGYRNSNGEWAEQRRRIDQGEGGKTVLIGSSRVLFDVQLPVWEKISGERPIQLAMEGTSPLPVMEDLAADPDFTGRLLVGVAPDIFFSGFTYRGDVLPYFHKQSPSQRTGNWLSKRLVEPYFAFDAPDFALAALVVRQPWPERPGLRTHHDVRKLAMQEADRNSYMWSKLETDPDYRALARRIWLEHLGGPPPPEADTPEKMRKLIDTQIQRAVDALAKLRARGVDVLFVRPPSTGEYYAFEQKNMPRALTWDVLLQRTGAPGIHFEDYAELQGYDSPEWSHLSASEATRFTAALVSIIQRDFWKPQPPEPGTLR